VDFIIINNSEVTFFLEKYEKKKHMPLSALLHVIEADTSRPP
jgi:hypothetical protein